MFARTSSCTRSLVCSRWQSICGRSIRAVRNENGTGGSSPRSTRNVPSATGASKSMLSRSSRGGVPVFSRPHSKPNDFSDSASSRDGGSPTRPAGRCSGPM